MYKIGLFLVVVGLFLLLAGLAWDTTGHASGAHDQGTEELFSLANRSHALLGLGLVLVVTGAFLGLVEQQPTLRALSLPSLVGVALLGFAVAVLTFGLSVDTTGHDHSVVEGDQDADALLAELRQAGLSEDDIALIQTSRHDHGAEVTFTLADLQELAAQVAIATEVANQYESIDSALAAGYVQVTQDLPRIGAHFLNLDLAQDGEFEVEKPEMLIYHFQDGEWQLYGLSYLDKVLGEDGDLPPEGFAGSFDVWHWHEDWCFTLKGARISDGSDCKLPLEFFAPRTGYMMHLWIVDNPEGLFSHAHPGLRGSDEYILPGTFPLGASAGRSTP